MPIKLLTLVQAENLSALREALERKAADFPGLLRLNFNKVLPAEVRPGDGVRWDAVVEGWFEDRSALDAWKAAAPGGRETAHFIVEQKLIHDHGRRPLPAKVFVAFRRRPDKTRAESQAHWLGPHVDIGLLEHNAMDFLQLYLQNHVIAGNPIERQGYDYDGLPEYWLDPQALGSVGPDSEVMLAIARDEEHFADRSSLVTMLVEEQELFYRPGSGTSWEPEALSLDTRFLAVNRRASFTK
jgi:hypothetical protein